jgi:ATP-dependent RNA helicase DeaD
MNNDSKESTPSDFSKILSDNELVAALKAISITSPTDVQALAIPAVGRGSDLIIQAKTGSGKTFAFALPLLQAIKTKKDQRGTLAIIISPTRELALQTANVITSVSSDLKPACLIGGASIGGQIKQLRDDARIVVGTPGRILDLIKQRVLILRKCAMFVLDEADEMLSMGFVEEVRAILSRLPNNRQGMFFSATITPRVKMLAQSFLKEPEIIVVGSENEIAHEIEHFVCKVEAGITSKANALCALLEKEDAQSAIVFCNTKSETELVEVFLKRRGFNASRINSDLTQKARDSIMKKLRSGTLRYLIATDVAARGIDLEQLELVVNYSIHEQAETYVHRTGRTGRAGRSGKAVSLVGPQDFSAFYNLKKSFPKEIKELELSATAEEPQIA